MSSHVVEVQQLSRRFGKSLALDQISFDIQPGWVYGLVGANGAGKTTLMKHLLGLLRAKEGSVRVFGLDPVRNPVEVLSRVGYLSEERDLPEWMRVDELLSYTGAYYPAWDRQYAQELLDTFALDPSKKVKQLSKGMRAQAGLIAAVAHHPELLLLDEPSTGLDAVVRKDILNAIIRTVTNAGRTAIFSSHLLDEVELMSDYVLMVDRGRLVLHGSLDEIRQRHQLLTVNFPTAINAPSVVEGVLSVQGLGKQWTLLCDGDTQGTQRILRSQGAEVTQSRAASLQEIFLARARKKFDD
jgi:ABC-2 type transport system ATP-binding protein